MVTSCNPSAFRTSEIEHHLAADKQQIGILLDQERFVASLQHMPYTAMTPVVMLRVDAMS
jgi:hypothetical protein